MLAPQKHSFTTRLKSDSFILDMFVLWSIISNSLYCHLFFQQNLINSTVVAIITTLKLPPHFMSKVISKRTGLVYLVQFSFTFQIPQGNSKICSTPSIQIKLKNVLKIWRVKLFIVRLGRVQYRDTRCVPG